VSTKSQDGTSFVAQLRDKVRELERRYSAAFEAFKANQAWMSLLAGIGVRALYEADLLKGLPADTIRKARRAWEHSSEYLGFRNEIADLARDIDRIAHVAMRRPPSFRDVHLARRPETKLVRLANILDLIESPTEPSVPHTRRRRPSTSRAKKKSMADRYLEVVAIAVAAYFGILAVLPATSSLVLRAVAAGIGAGAIIGLVLFMARLISK